MSPSGNAPALAEEQRVRFWSRPALDSPSLQQRVRHAWGAVQSPTGTPPMSPWLILQQSFVNKLLCTDGMHAGSWCMLVHGACCFAFRAYQEPTRVRFVLWLSIAVQDERIFKRSMLYAAEC